MSLITLEDLKGGVPPPPAPSVPAWPPTRWTPPLKKNFPSVFGRYRAVFHIAWRAAHGYDLDAWQEHLLEAVTEIDPATGRLRHRQVLISMARQSGKTEIAAALGLLVLIWKRAAMVIGIAHSAEQARLVYDRTMRTISRNPSLAARFDALTDTRGIRASDGGRYEIKASKSAALQGIPIDLGMVDEVHLLKIALWTDLVSGLGGRPDCLVVGITTAGDNDSEALLHLYGLAESGEVPGFAHFIWEAPEAKVPEDDETLGQYLLAANPAIAAGRIDLATVISDCRSMPEPDVVRYRSNRFISSSNGYIGAGVWMAAARGEGESFPAGRPVFAIDRTPDWGAASIVAAVRDGETTHTELVASLVRPTLERLVEAALSLSRHAPVSYVVDGYQLRSLGLELKKRGLPVTIIGMPEMVNASSLLHAKITAGTFKHGGEPLLAVQVPRTVRKNVGEGYRISRKESSIEIDAVVATALAVHGAEAAQPAGLGIY